MKECIHTTVFAVYPWYAEHLSLGGERGQRFCSREREFRTDSYASREKGSAWYAFWSAVVFRGFVDGAVFLFLFLASAPVLGKQAWGLPNRSEDMATMRYQTKPVETRTLKVPTR